MSPTSSLFHGDCLEILPTLDESSVDLIATDLPYGSTAHGWDERIPLVPLWSEFKRVLKPDGCVVLTADLRLAVALLESAPKGWFRYDLVWDKVITTGYLDANRRPLRRHEYVLVFSPKGYPTYNPIKGIGKPQIANKKRSLSSAYGTHKLVPTTCSNSRYPTSVLSISNANRSGKRHPTEKPQALMTYLIRTYSDEGDTVLDSSMGCGSTGIAALWCGRNFIGIEKDESFFEIARSRIEEVVVV